MKGKLFVTAAILVATACSPKSSEMSDELKKELDVAASSDGLSLASAGQSQQIVSSIEQAAPAPKRIAASQRAVRHRCAEVGTPAPVIAEAEVPTSETELQSISDAPVATSDDAPVAPRPTPVITNMPGGNGEGRGDSGVGVGTGVAIGTIIGVVLRGGGVGEDHCEPPGQRSGARRPTIAINSRIPVIRGTFPGRVSGRVR